VSASAGAVRKRGTAARLASFVATRFTPPVYATYGVLWALSLEAAVDALAGTRWQPSWATVPRAVSVVFALLFLRMLDEQKDLAYDREHNPDRPLVTGAVTVGELRAAMVVLAAVGAVANVAVSVASALVYLAVLGYGLLLAVAERAYPRLADDQLAGLFAAYPVQVVLSAYLLVSVGAHAGWGVAAVLIAYAGAFLHFEIARKTRWDGAEGERLYSQILGPVGSAAVAAGCAAAACGGVLAVCLPHSPAPWLPALVALPAVWGTAVFLRRRTGAWPMAPAMAVILLTHVELVVIGATVN
jgi:hypothetical protein